MLPFFRYLQLAIVKKRVLKHHHPLDEKREKKIKKIETTSPEEELNGHKFYYVQHTLFCV